MDQGEAQVAPSGGAVVTEQALPIFVLGLQRSGTTWAANLLAAHPQIAAIEAERHHGVHESVFFSHFARIFGDWSDPAGKSRALEAFLNSDYCLLADLPEERLRAIAAATDSAAAFFVTFMDEVAKSRGRLAWVEKSPHHTLLADALAAAIPRARFLCITRSSRTLVRSRLWSYGRTPPPYPARAFHILRACGSNAFHSRFLGQFAKRLGPKRVQLITFEEFQHHGAAVLDPFLAGCGLVPMGNVTSAYARNSSFGSEASRKQALGRLDLVLIWVCDRVVRFAPAGLLRNLQHRIAARRPAGFPDWVWASAPAGTSAIASTRINQ